MRSPYVSPEAGDMERYWNVGARTPWQVSEVYPRAPGLFIRAERDATEPNRELLIGQWGLVPWFAKAAKLTYSTNDARFEEITAEASFKHFRQYCKRCIIPAMSFDEPNWETGKNVWWRLRRADGTPWGLAGLWNTWTDKASAEIVESYDAHVECRRAPADEPHAQARSKARTGRAGQAQRSVDRIRGC